MKHTILTLALLATTACTSTFRPYTIQHADGSYTRTMIDPKSSTWVECGRGLWRNVDIINRQTTHSPNITDTMAQLICADTIR